MQSPSHAIEAVTAADPFSYYRRLREERPLFFDEKLGLWVASTHTIVNEALHHAALRVRPPAEPVPKALLGTGAGAVFSQLVRMTDGAFHAEHKPAVEQAARRWSMTDVASAAQEAARHLRPRLSVNEFLSAWPVQAIARLLGVADAALDDTVRWVRQFVQGIAPGASAQDVVQAAAAAEALMAQGTAQGLASVQAANRIAFMQQSLDATAGLLGHMALMFASEPSWAAQADQSLEAMRAFVAEVERYCAPIQNTRRFAAEPLMLAGQSIAPGQGILLVLASANRDEALNPLPDRFDPERAQRRSMGFGAGPHACPGAAIAIEIAASTAYWLRAQGQWKGFFGRHAGFRPLGNARIPVFA
jgi:cytochrome P450